MRRVVDIVIVLSVAGVIGWMVHYRMNAQNLDEDAVFVRQEVRRFELEIKLRAATENAELTGRDWPMTIDPAWFESPPQNTLVSRDRPWVDVAPPEHADLSNPVMRLAMDHTYASFWYNPYQGIIRARVPMAINDEQALRLYNEVNGTSLIKLYVAPPVVAEAEPVSAPDEDEPNDPNSIDQIFFRTHTENESGKTVKRLSGAGDG